MAVTCAQARRFALGLPGVYEEPHFDFGSFRVNKRIFVTVPPGAMLHVFVADAERDMCLEVYASCTEALLWGGKCVGIRLFLKKATRGALEDLVLRAWKFRAGKKELAAYEQAGAPAARPKKKAKAMQQRKSATRDAAASVAAYIAGFPADVRARLEKVRAAIRKAAPQAEETISYRIPAYKLAGSLVFFAAYPKHIGLYPAPRASAEFRDELAAYAGGKGTVQFPHAAALPLDLIRRIVKFRAAENLARAARRRRTTTKSTSKGTRPAAA